MREIKFRAWQEAKPHNDGFDYMRIQESVMKYDIQEGCSIKGCTCSDTLQAWIDNPNNTVEQYTEFTVDGAEIYEGDILKVAEHYEGDHRVPEALGVVVMQEGEWQIINPNAKHYLTTYFGLWEAVNNWGVEIIGNIHENNDVTMETT